ncbi:MAG: hypothetical protein FIB05_15870 [Betaproteobacteria bacterium]|nr:hypothetical protein [Betaproteobacteria bacterium]
MNAPSGRYAARTLELLPIDDYPLPAAPAPSPARAGTSDARSIRDAYLRARFPGVIRGAEDLEDASRVADAIHCYRLDGRDDRANELRELAGLADPRRGQACGRDRDHAARIHRWLSR